ncbi:amidase family protein [Hwangdonia lutea]|uniref:Amidase family protein n=1 Tax=Hwangdonia lutea TaxID=3075823 RepID=A0AA97EKT4_9FLAO|nr:amidase family protein [Hwangdonia sp. SCSIO 19198]WOD43259.1 amidase family protein [Hwangdonia sp. SCSIO 19198]
MRLSIFFLLSFLIYSCKNPKTENTVSDSQTLNDSIVTSNDSIKDFREFKVLDSKFIDVSQLWQPFENDLKDFTAETYNNLKPLILEADIPTLQNHISEGHLSYELLTKFYLYRIKKFDRENSLSLNSVISLNPNAIKEAIEADQTDFEVEPHPIYGMPILLKDNINTSGMPTTAGAVALQNNNTDDAFVVKQLKRKGAIILGKANLSEWAYFFCNDCPSGYSAIGGQTLNPYGRRIMDTGGSSSGSGVAVAANFCVAAVGSETSGSILSPSSQNSIVGLKPTIGLLSRSGIVPISSTLDTPGPMTKNVTDNAIVLDAMLGFDNNDSKSIDTTSETGFYNSNMLFKADFSGKRFGAFKRLLEDSLYVQAIADLKSKGAKIIEIEEEKNDLPDFLRLLNLDMKNDLPKYLSDDASNDVVVTSVKDVIDFNKKDSVNRMPYGQKLFEGIVADSAANEAFQNIKNTLKTNGRRFYDKPMKAHNLDGFLSINNYHAGFAAVAEYPAITVPMGYTEKGAPKGLTFISKPLSENDLLQWAYIYEQVSKRRKAPKNYN